MQEFVKSDKFPLHVFLVYNRFERSTKIALLLSHSLISVYILSRVTQDWESCDQLMSSKLVILLPW